MIELVDIEEVAVAGAESDFEVVAGAVVFGVVGRVDAGAIVDTVQLVIALDIDQ